MGSCVTKLELSQDLYLSLKADPSDLKTLLVLQLHWSLYDKESQKKIDEITQLSLGADKHLHLEVFKQ